jgi:hypothetical protein
MRGKGRDRDHDFIGARRIVDLYFFLELPGSLNRRQAYIALSISWRDTAGSTFAPNFFSATTRVSPCKRNAAPSINSAASSMRALSTPDSKAENIPNASVAAAVASVSMNKLTSRRQTVERLNG